jgi:hypothetical protein
MNGHTFMVTISRDHRLPAGDGTNNAENERVEPRDQQD